MKPAQLAPLTPAALVKLLARAKVSQRSAAAILQINERTMRRYIAGDQPTPRVVQFALLFLAANPE